MGGQVLCSMMMIFDDKDDEEEEEEEEGHVRWGGRGQVHCSINLKTVKSIWLAGAHKYIFGRHKELYIWAQLSPAPCHNMS